MKHIILFISLLCIPALLFAGEQRKVKKANEQTAEWRYEIQTEAVGAQNTVLVKVWSYSKDVNVARKQGVKNALHGLIFKGAAGNNDASKRVNALRPLVSDPNIEAQYADFFGEFFADGGAYARYATVANDSASGSVVKMGKEYKVAVVITVQYEALRKMLEGKGIAKGLSSGF